MAQNRVLLVEAWRDQAALDVHSKGPMPHSEAANTNRGDIIGGEVDLSSDFGIAALQSTSWLS